MKKKKRKGKEFGVLTPYQRWLHKEKIRIRHKRKSKYLEQLIDLD